MSTASLQDILNYVAVDSQLASSGQPRAGQFALIAGAGFEAVINLALPTSTHALTDEAAIVTGLGLTYLQHPVQWEAPTVADVALFFRLLDALEGRKIWVHCALNMRVSCFLYFYRRYRQGLPEPEARAPMAGIWTPEGVWADLCRAMEVEGPRLGQTAP